MEDTNEIDKFTQGLVRELARVLLMLWQLTDDEGNPLPEAVEDLGSILHSIRSGEPHYQSNSSPQGCPTNLWREMWPLAYFWMSELAEGSLPDGLLASGKFEHYSGVYFISIALKAIGRQFSYAEFCQHFRFMVHDLAREMDCLDEFLEKSRLLAI